MKNSCLISAFYLPCYSRVRLAPPVLEVDHGEDGENFKNVFLCQTAFHDFFPCENPFSHLASLCVSFAAPLLNSFLTAGILPPLLLGAGSAEANATTNNSNKAAAQHPKALHRDILISKRGEKNHICLEENIRTACMGAFLFG